MFIFFSNINMFILQLHLPILHSESKKKNFNLIVSYNGAFVCSAFFFLWAYLAKYFIQAQIQTRCLSENLGCLPFNFLVGGSDYMQIWIQGTCLFLENP